MENQKLTSSLNLPDEWQPKYYVHLVKQEKPILITQEEYDRILNSLSKGQNFVKIRSYIIMLNSITIIAPRYEPNNIPPRPEPIQIMDFDNEKQMGFQRLMNKDELDLWDKTFGAKASALEVYE